MTNLIPDAAQFPDYSAKFLRQLYRACGAWLSAEDRMQVRQAYFFSSQAHANHVRKSGEPYIQHPVEVAAILCTEMGYIDRTAIIAALIHDVVEDTEYELPEIRKLFGRPVARIVDGLTKISVLGNPENTKKAETYRKMLLTMSDDIRVALIKIADRLHNMRTIEFMKPEKRIRIATETMYLYAPLAHRLGLYPIKSELEDRSLKILEPDVYQSITQSLSESRAERVQFIKEFIQPLKLTLQEQLAEYQVSITGRVKSIFSIHSKMKRQEIEFEDVYDVFAIRIVFDLSEPDRSKEIDACWDIYKLITKRYKPDQTRLRDWLSTPKSNGYEALHLTVRTGMGRPVEIQIRSKRMDDQAEKGIAAHWKYKEGHGPTGEEQFEEWLRRIRSQLDNTYLQGHDLMMELKTNIESEPIFVFSRTDGMRAMNPGCTVLDFAIETLGELGLHCIGAKVNYKLQPIDYELHNGDHIEILTSQNQLPQREWIRKVHTLKAQKCINDFLDQKANDKKAAGKRFFESNAKRFGISYDHAFVRELLERLNLKDMDEFYYQIGSRSLKTETVSHFIEEKMKVIDELQDYSNNRVITESSELLSRMTNMARGVDLDSLLVDNKISTENKSIAQCCQPIDGDEIVGFLINKEYHIHRTSCPQAIELMTYKDTPMVNVKWVKRANRTDISFLTGIEFAGADRRGMLADIVEVISVHHKAYIRSITIDTFNEMFQGTIKLYVPNTLELEAIVNELQSLDDLVTVKRIQT